MFNKLKIFSGEEVRSPLPKQSKQTVKCLRTAEVLVRPLKVFCRHKHLALSEAQHVPTCSPVKQLPLQVYTAYFPHFPLFSSSLIEGLTWGQGCFWEPEAQDLPPHRLSSRFNPRSPRTNPTTSDTRTQSQRR